MSPEFPRRGGGLWWRFLLAGLVIVVLSAGVTATIGLNTVQGFVDDLKQGGTIKDAGSVITRAQAGQPQTILLIGSDHRFGAATRDARSDTMILVRLDPDANATTVLSVPRDLRVDFQVPGGGYRTGAKINETYSDGGEVLTARVIGGLLHIPINHIVNINFGGFREAVDAIGCVYADVDRWYYHSNAGAAEQYAEIDVSPGYQMLCGGKALDYVRYRHTDSDFVRAARQQDFLRQIKSQYGASQFLADPHKLTKQIGKYMQTDASLQSKEELLRLVYLVGYSAKHSVYQVHFPETYLNLPGGSYVTATPAQLAQVRHEFLSPPPKEPKAQPAGGGPGQSGRGRGPKGAGGAPPSGLVNAKSIGESYAIQLGAIPFPVYYPKLLTSRGQYMPPQRAAGGRSEYPRAYRIKVPGDKLEAAYRLVVSEGEIGNYYGIQGTAWTDPPILRNPSADSRTIGGKRLLLFYDGKHLRTVGWKTPHAAYWVENTLQERLSNDQMLAIAGSLTRLGGR
ncbi:MAG TPA: LCP family protein [Conexibacter sp.]|jgi:LCP family protein required for cell wall assembly|nr:LCP family protein [Conexibacter sp.]